MMDVYITFVKVNSIFLVTFVNAKFLLVVSNHFFKYKFKVTIKPWINVPKTKLSTTNNKLVSLSNYPRSIACCSNFEEIQGNILANIEGVKYV